MFPVTLKTTHKNFLKTMSLKKHLESAEESIRQAIIESLNAKKDENISDLFKALTIVGDINNKIQESFEIDGNINLDSLINNEPLTFDSSYNFTSGVENQNYVINTDGLINTDTIPGARHGGDLDSLDNVISFTTGNDVIKEKD